MYADSNHAGQLEVIFYAGKKTHNRQFQEVQDFFDPQIVPGHNTFLMYMKGLTKNSMVIKSLNHWQKDFGDEEPKLENMRILFRFVPIFCISKCAVVQLFDMDGFDSSKISHFL